MPFSQTNTVIALTLRIDEDPGNPDTVLLSPEDFSGLSLNDSDYEIESRFVCLAHKEGSRIWHPACGTDRLPTGVAAVPQRLLANLPGATAGTSVKVSRFDLTTLSVIRSVGLKRVAPADLPLGSFRSYFHNFFRCLRIPLALHQRLSVAVKLHTNQIVEVQFVIVRLASEIEDESGPFMMPADSTVRVEINLSDLGFSEDAGEHATLRGYHRVGGLQKQVDQVREVVELPLMRPELFKKLGVRPAKGILLTGPPGTGKTLIARAVAQETAARFFAFNASEMFSMYAGQGEARMRELFARAAECAQAIIFIDEIDALAANRDSAQEDFARRMAGQFLPLLDGVEQDGRVVVIAATNRPGAIDPAFRRPGRFDREIHIGIPDESGRRDILGIHSRSMALDEDVCLNSLAAITGGYVGADLEALCREAGMVAFKRRVAHDDQACSDDDLRVTMADFHTAQTGFVPSTRRLWQSTRKSVPWSQCPDFSGVKSALQANLSASLKAPRWAVQILETGSHAQIATVLNSWAAVEGMAYMEFHLNDEIHGRNRPVEAVLRSLGDTALASAPALIFAPRLTSHLACMSDSEAARTLLALEILLDRLHQPGCPPVLFYSTGSIPQAHPALLPLLHAAQIQTRTKPL